MELNSWGLEGLPLGNHFHCADEQFEMVEEGVASFLQTGFQVFKTASRIIEVEVIQLILILPNPDGGPAEPDDGGSGGGLFGLRGGSPVWGDTTWEWPFGFIESKPPSKERSES